MSPKYAIALAILIGGVLLAIVVCWIRCPHPGYDAVLKSGMRDVPEVADLNRLFPNTQNRITYFTGEYGSPTWMSRAGAHSRYVIVIEMPIELDRCQGRIRTHGSPQLYVMEIAGIELRPSGRVVIKHGDTHRVDASQWADFIQSKGDLRNLIDNVREGEPVPGFEEHFDKF